MSYLATWAAFACGVMAYVLLGMLFGWDTSALRADLVPMLFGAAVGLAIHSSWKDK